MLFAPRFARLWRVLDLRGVPVLPYPRTYKRQERSFRPPAASPRISILTPFHGRIWTKRRLMTEFLVRLT